MKIKIPGFLAQVAMSILKFLPVKVVTVQTSAAEIPPGGATLVMDLSIDRPCVGVTIDGNGPYPFILDTGAAASVIDSSLAEELGLRVVGKALVGDPTGSQPVETQRVAADRLILGNSSETGDVRVPDASLICVDLRARFGDSFAGVLSIGHFAQVLLTLDFPVQQIRLREGTLDSHQPGVTGYKPRRGLIEVRVDIDGKSIPLHLDSGAPGGFTLLRKTADRLRLQSDPVEGKTARMLGTEVTRWHTQLQGTLRFADHKFEDPEVELIDVGDRGTLGPEVLKHFAMTIDQKKQCIRFERPPE